MRARAFMLICAAATGLAGCGQGAGVKAGAAVDVYAGALTCPGARQALGGNAGKAGEVEVRLVCLPPVVGPGDGRINLATQGANARRASEDSAAVAFLEAPGKPAEFAAPIVDEAGIAFVAAKDGAAAMERVLRVIAEGGMSGSPREKVSDALE